MSGVANREVIVVGGGPGGIAAALWCDELGLDTLLIEKRDSLGGQLSHVYNPIENHLGVVAKDGSDLIAKINQQIEGRGFERLKGEAVDSINYRGKSLRVGDQEIGYEFLILATGVSRRELGVEGEKEFNGKGILKSGKRQAYEMKGKRVAVVGGGDAALENSLILADEAERVYLICRGKGFRARKEFQGLIKNIKKIKILKETVVKAFEGDGHLERIKLFDSNTNEHQELEVGGAIVRIGVVPNNELVADFIKHDSDGYVFIDRNCQTNIESIFAIGDLANPVSPTVSSAIGMAATAAKNIRSIYR